MEHSDRALGAQPRQGGFQLHRLINGLLDNGLDSWFAPAAERASAETAGKSPDAKHTGIVRHTKDLDIRVRRRDRDPVARTLHAAGHRTEAPFPHWLAKAHGEDGFIDVIYSSGNGVTEVDEEWFEHASDGDILGVPVKLCPAEEMIWCKS
jgi:hypothetical protein